MNDKLSKIDDLLNGNLYLYYFGIYEFIGTERGKYIFQNVNDDSYQKVSYETLLNDKNYIFIDKLEVNKMTREEIKQEIIYDLAKAWENPNEMSYWLEKLPMQGDYDEAVHEYINDLKYMIKHRYKDYFKSIVDDLVYYYYINQESYWC